MSVNPFMEDTTVGGIPCFTWTIRKYLPENKQKREFSIRIQMFLLTYVTYSLFNMARRPIAVVKSKIIAECERAASANNSKDGSEGWCNETFLVSSTEEIMGLMDFVYVFSYGIFLFVSGVVADCYNPRYYLTAGCLLSGFCCALLGLANYWNIKSFKFLSTALILYGAAQSTGWPVVLSCVTHWYSGRKRGIFFGFWNTHNYLGSILGIYLAEFFVDRNWMWSYFLPGFILAFMAILVFLCMVADPEDLRKLDKVPEVTSRRRTILPEMPPWFSSNQAIQIADALLLPGVIEFSLCMFFSRMVGYIFLFWLPTFMKEASDYSMTAALCMIAYVIGGSIGGILAGILIDLLQRRAIVCVSFLLVSMPILVLGFISELGGNLNIDFPIFLLIGLFVEAPYVIIVTSISAELATHKMIKRNHRALATIGGIIEGAGAIGASVATAVCGLLMAEYEWKYVLYLMIPLQFIAAACLTRQAYQDIFKEELSFKGLWKPPGV